MTKCFQKLVTDNKPRTRETKGNAKQDKCKRQNKAKQNT